MKTILIGSALFASLAATGCRSDYEKTIGDALARCKDEVAAHLVSHKDAEFYLVKTLFGRGPDR